MDYRLGIEIGVERSVWAAHDGQRIVADGTVASSVALTTDGRVLAGDALAALPPAAVLEPVHGFVARLGEPEPIIVGGTPYGAEALTAVVVADACAAAARRLGDSPGAVVLVHPDGLDAYRAGLLAEAARLAGVPAATTVLVTHSTALAAAHQAGLGSAIAGAAGLGWHHVPRTPGDHTLTAGAAGAVGGAAGGAAGAAVITSGGGVASAGAPLVAGPGGTPLAPSAGPTGTPLAPSAGTTGTPLTPASGPGGTPLAPSASPTGTPLTPSGAPTGTPTAHGGLPHSVGLAKRARPKWLNPVVAGGAVAAVVTIGVVVATRDDEPSTRPATTPTVAVATTNGGAPEAGGTVPVDGAGTTVAAVEEVDVSGLLGLYEGPCDPYLAGDGASRGRWELTDTGVNQVTLTASAWEYTDPGCAQGEENPMNMPYTLTVVGTVEIEGIQGWRLIADFGAPQVLAVTPEGVLRFGAASPVDAEGFPTSLDPDPELFGQPLGRNA